jgi:regulatory protein
MVRFSDSGGESDVRSVGGLAPVIPLFVPSASRSATAPPSADAPAAAPAPRWNATWADEPADGGDEEPDRGVGAQHGDDDGSALEREIAEKNLLKRLRARSLSVKEARAVVAERDLDDDVIDAVLTGFLDRGYLNDAALAEQLIHAGVDRKGQGRQVIAQTLAKRGIPRDVADAALATLPDDDMERALEYARGKARSLRDLDHEVAVRRLTGQLARRGYPGSVALTAAKSALAGEASGRSGVRFD